MAQQNPTVKSVVGSSIFNSEEMEGRNLYSITLVEPVVAAHLHPMMSLSSPGSALPSRVRLLPEKAHKTATPLVHALSTASFLMAYQAKLEEEMTVSSYPVLCEEERIITDHFLHLHKKQYRHRAEPWG